MKKIGNVAKVLKLVIPIAPFGMALYLLLSLPGGGIAGFYAAHAKDGCGSCGAL